MALHAARYQAVFLDRDGVLNENRPDHVKQWSEFRFLPGAHEAVARLTHAGVRVFVTTNQAAVSRGLMPLATLHEVHERMRQSLANKGGHIEAIAYCPHTPDAGCACRKPRPGQLHDLARKHGLDLSRCMAVGDALTDVYAGRAAGCDVTLVLSGRGREQHALAAASGCQQDYGLAADLWEATDLLLRPQLAYR